VLQSVPICGCSFAVGKLTCVSLSSTFCRFQSFTELSSKIMITNDRPKIDSERRNVSAESRSSGFRPES
jgi:hypothetical protein